MTCGPRRPQPQRPHTAAGAWPPPPAVAVSLRGWRRHRRGTQHVASAAAASPTPPPPPTIEHPLTPTGFQWSTYPQRTRYSSFSPYPLHRQCSVGGRHLPDLQHHVVSPQSCRHPRCASRPQATGTAATARAATLSATTQPPIRTFERKTLSQASEATFSESPKNLREHDHIRPGQPALTTPKTPHLPSRAFLTTICSRGPYGR